MFKGMIVVYEFQVTVKACAVIRVFPQGACTVAQKNLDDIGGRHALCVCKFRFKLFLECHGVFFGHVRYVATCQAFRRFASFRHSAIKRDCAHHGIAIGSAGRLGICCGGTCCGTSSFRVHLFRFVQQDIGAIHTRHKYTRPFRYILLRTNAPVQCRLFFAHPCCNSFQTALDLGGVRMKQRTLF